MPLKNNLKAQNAASSKTFAAFLFLTMSLLIAWLLITLKFIFLPMLLALFVTFLLSPPVEWLRQKGIPRGFGIPVVLAAMIALFWLGGRYLIASFVAFRDGFPKYEERLTELFTQAKAIPEHFPFITTERIQTLLGNISLSGLVGDTLNSFITVLAYISVTLLFMLYFLPALPQFPAKLNQAFPDKRGAILRRAFESIGDQVQSYIWAKTLTSIITGVGVAVPCFLFGVDFAITWGVFAAFLNLVPTIGPLLSVVPPVLVAALQPDLGSLSLVIWLAIVLSLVMFLTGNIMEPLMLGQSVNLSPTASLIALFLWGWLWGTVGMLIAVPAMAIIKVVCDNIPGLKPLGVLLGN